MAKAMDGREAVTLEEMVLVQMFESEALLNVLERKGLLTKAEVLDEGRRLREQAARAHYAAENPVRELSRRGVAWEKERRIMARPLTRDEETRMLAALPFPYREAAILTLNLGLRARELRMQRWADIDFERRMLHVTEPKSTSADVNQDLPSMTRRGRCFGGCPGRYQRSFLTFRCIGTKASTATWCRRA